MGKYLKSIVPACIGSSLALSLLNYFRHPGLWSLGELLLNFLFMFLVTLAIVSLCFWIWSRLKRK